MQASNTKLNYEDLAAKTRTFVELMRIYRRCSHNIQEAVVNMIDLIDDPSATEEDRERAYGTIAGALLAFAEEESTQAHSRSGEFRLAIPAATRAAIRDSQRQFAERLQAVRAQRQWTQQELASRSGVGQPAISMLEAGLCRPQAATLMKLAKALGVSKNELWPGRQPPGNGQGADPNRTALNATRSKVEA